MAALGKKQLAFISDLSGKGVAVVVGDPLIRSLVKRGTMRALGDESFFVLTSNGLRAVADAMDAGTIPPLTIEDFKSRARAR